MKNKIASLVLLLSFFSFACAQEPKTLLIDDFEGALSSDTVDFGAGAGSFVDVSASTEIKNSGRQSLRIDFDAVAGGYMWVARGYGLTVLGAGAWKVEPKYIDWAKYDTLAFHMHGANTGAPIAVDIIDSGREYWRYMIEDNFTGWKEFRLSLNEFFARGDWQPDGADKNASLDFPLQAFQFEPRPEGKGTIYIDDLMLINAGK